jgi:hypothetical protein
LLLIRSTPYVLVIEETGLEIMINYVLATVREWRERRRSLEALAGLTDRQLRDMGVYRPRLKSTLCWPLDAA